MNNEVEEKGVRREVLGTARGGGMSLAAAIFNQILKLLITLLLARFLGRSQAGLYFQGFAVLVLLGILSAGGFKHSLTRFVAIHRADDDPEGLRGTVRLGLFFSTSVATAFTALLYAASDWLALEVFDDPRMATVLRYVAFALPPTVFTDVALAATQGFKTMRPYARINLVLEPLIRILLTIPFLWAGLGVNGAMMALLLTNLVAAVLSAMALKRLLGTPITSVRYSARPLLAFSAVAWGSQLASSGLLWADTIILGIYASPADVGVYQVATRLTALATTAIAPLGAAFSPRVADLYRRGHHVTLQRTYAMVTSWIVRLAVPAFAVLILFPRELLSFFGPGFVQGAGVTVLLAFGQTFNAATGPCGYMLLMSGRPALQMTSNLLALSLNIGLNVWLIPQYGIVGAGSAWAASIALTNIVRVIAVRRTLGMWPFDVGILKGIVAGAASIAAARVVAVPLEGTISLLLGCSVIAIVYLSVLVFLRIGSDDRIVLETMWRQLRLTRA
jgi:O-antigen/teichoic acid export membrane protein